MSFKKLPLETVRALVGIGRTLGATSMVMPHGPRVCDHCQNEDREAFPYYAVDENGREWAHLCNPCFDILGCSFDEFIRANG